MEKGTIIEQVFPAIPWPVTREQESRTESEKEDTNMQLRNSLQMVSTLVGCVMGSGFTTPTERTLNQYPTVDLY